MGGKGGIFMKSSPVSARPKIYRIALVAMFIAIHVILSMVPSEVSWASLPVLVCAFLLGPIDTVTVAVFGSFIEQLQYGINIATVFWILPWLIFGLVAGFLAWFIRKGNERVWKIVLVIVVSELILNIANTAALCGFGYVAIDFSAPHLVLLAFIVRMPHAIIRAVLSSVAIPLLIRPLRRTIERLH